MFNTTVVLLVTPYKSQEYMMDQLYSVECDLLHPFKPVMFNTTVVMIVSPSMGQELFV